MDDFPHLEAVRRPFPATRNIRTHTGLEWRKERKDRRRDSRGGAARKFGGQTRGRARGRAKAKAKVKVKTVANAPDKTKANGAVQRQGRVQVVHVGDRKAGKNQHVGRKQHAPRTAPPTDGEDAMTLSLQTELARIGQVAWGVGCREVVTGVYRILEAHPDLVKPRSRVHPPFPCRSGGVCPCKLYHGANATRKEREKWVKAWNQRAKRCDTGAVRGKRPRRTARATRVSRGLRCTPADELAVMACSRALATVRKEVDAWANRTMM